MHAARFSSNFRILCTGFEHSFRILARFCGVEILTYCIMTNHFHVLVRVPEEQKMSDSELVARFAQLYCNQKGKVETLKVVLKKGGEEA